MGILGLLLSLLSLATAMAVSHNGSPLSTSIHKKKKPLLYASARTSPSLSISGREWQDDDDDDDDNCDSWDEDLELLHRSSSARISAAQLVSSSRGGAAAANISNNAWVDGLKNSLASALAAAFSKTILAPFDTIKTLQQYHQTSPDIPSLTLMEAATRIMQRPGGFLNFYAGLGVSVLGAMPSVAMYFGTYSYCKKALSAPRTRADGSTYTLPRTLIIGLSAATGNTLASFSRVPYEVLKQKLQTNTYRNTWEALRAINGWEMIFPKGGVTIQMMRDIPYAVVTLLLYEHLQAWAISHQQKQQQQKSNNKKQQSAELQQASQDMVLGAISGGLGSWVTNPLDVVKTRLQTAPPETYGGSISKCFIDTWQEGGGMAFLRGSWPRLMHKIPANGFFFLFYEFFRRALRCQGYGNESSNSSSNSKVNAKKK